MTLDEQYAAIESRTREFSRETGISCPAGCGQCCTAINFSVSRPEANRVAEFLLDHPAQLARVESVLAELGEAETVVSPVKTQCLFYDAENLAAHCTVYEARPLLCRTFAFSARRTRDGALEYVPCHRFHEDTALDAKVARASESVRTGHASLPILPDESLAIWSLDPAGAEAGLPMGPAVAQALESLRYRRSLSGD